MRKRRHRGEQIFLLLLISCMLFSGIFFVGNVFAFMYKKTDVVSNKFEIAKVACTVQKLTDANGKISIVIKNDDSVSKGSNIEAYLRVRIVSNWVDSDGNVIGKASVMPKIEYDETNWIKSDTKDIYYYKNLVKPGDITQSLLEEGKFIVLETSTFHEIPVYQVIEFFAEGIQSAPVDAVETSWGVSLQDNGIGIVSVP